jgi:List-Bact-rpt repeat protein/centrosomal CEP192-like protein
MRGGARMLHLRLLISVLMVAAVVAAAAKVEAASLPLTWNAPTTSADGTPLTDLSSYRIYLGTSTPTCPSASFHTVSSPTSAPSTGATVSTRIAGLTAGTTYFARVTAVDLAGNESGCSGSVSGAAQPDFTVAPTGTTDFGSVAVNGTVDRNFTVQNRSTASISVTASVGSPFSIVSGGSGSLAAGASRTVTVRFRPTTIGSFAGNVNFTSGSDTLSRALTGSSTGTSTFALTVTKTGTGAGTVTSSPAGISCGTDCGESLAVGTPVTLTATAASGSTFVGWSGACSGTAATCSWTMSAATTVAATFNKVTAPTTSTATPPATPGSPTVTTLVVDATGVTFNVAWAAASSAASYRYIAGFNDGSASQQGTVTGILSFQLRMPYHASGAAFAGYVCIRSVGSTGLLSADQACSALSVPAPPAAAPAPVIGSLSPSSAVAGGPGFTLTVNGSGFAAASVVRWNGADRPTTVVSSAQLRAAISATDLASSGSVPVTVFTPAPGGGTSGSRSFTITAPVSSTPPGMPGNPTVTMASRDATGVTFNLTWSPATGATSYRYLAAFSDGSASQQGTVTSTSMQLRMPYHSTGAAFGAFVCIRAANAAGQLSADHACTPFTVPAR